MSRNLAGHISVIYSRGCPRSLLSISFVDLLKIEECATTERKLELQLISCAHERLDIHLMDFALAQQEAPLVAGDSDARLYVCRSHFCATIKTVGQRTCPGYGQL